MCTGKKPTKQCALVKHTLCICDDGWLSTLHGSHSRICGAQINANNLIDSIRNSSDFDGKAGTPYKGPPDVEQISNRYSQELNAAPSL